MNIINVNGKNFDVVGRNIVVRNGNVIVDGKQVIGDLTGNVHIIFTGDLAKLDCTSATINGNVQGDVNSTSLQCNDIGGNVDATNVKCNNIMGSVDATNVKIKKQQ
jgi:hypothetical protein